MTGTMKFILSTNCTEYCAHKYYINPRPDYIVSLEDKGILPVTDGLFKVFCYAGDPNEMDLVHMEYGSAIPKGRDSPPGMGILIKYQRPPLPLPMKYDFDFSFERIAVSELRKICPQPVLNVTSTKQVISTINWPDNGCTLRVHAEHPITMRGALPSRTTFYWKGNKTDSGQTGQAGNHAWYTLKSGTDIIYRPAQSEEEPKELIFVSLDYDHCRCPSNSRKLFYLEEDNFEMTIPPHCTHMMCRLTLRVPFTRHPKIWANANQMLHLDVDYQFHGDVLHVTGEHELLLHSASRREHFASDILSKYSMVQITYQRQGTPKGLTAISQWKIKWHWLTLNECSCGKTTRTAGAKWSAIYSPGYPQEYCANLTCDYNVEAPEGHHLKFWLSQFETELFRDVLYISEGSQTLLELSGYQPNHTINVETEGQKARVKFYSDHSIVSKGFKLSYIAIPDVDYLPAAVSSGYPLGIVIVGAILLLVLGLTVVGVYFLYRKKIFNRSIFPAYSFLSLASTVTEQEK